MAKFDESIHEMPISPVSTGRIYEPKCKVCTHPKRNQIDYLLAIKTKYKELERLFQIPYKSFSNHDRKHLNYEDEAIKRIIEYEAGIANENLEEGVKGAFLRRSALDIGIKRLFDGIVSGEIPLEAKDLPKLVELREELDSNTAAAQIEEYERQFSAFKSAVEELCPPDVLPEILNLTRQKLGIPIPLEIES